MKSGGDLPTFWVISWSLRRLTNILGYIVKSGGDLPTFWVISWSLRRLTNILGCIVKSEETYQHFGLYREVWGDLPTFWVIGEVWWRLTNILGNIVKSGGDLPTFWVISWSLVETYHHFGLYSEVWWRLTNIFGNIVKSGGDLTNIMGYDIVTSVAGSPSFWVIIRQIWRRLANILGCTVKCGVDVPTFFYDIVRFCGDFTNILTGCTASTNSAIRTSDVRKRLCFSSAFEMTKSDDSVQWRTQEFFSGGFNKFSWGQRTDRTGIWGR